MTKQRFKFALTALFITAAFTSIEVQEQEIGMFGNTPSRNMVSEEVNLPTEWDISSGKNVLWSQPVGSQAYGGAVVANGRVYVGTNDARVFLGRRPSTQRVFLGSSR